MLILRSPRAPALVLAAVLGLVVAKDAGAVRRYVAQDATGAGNGTSWADAFLHPQDALDVAGRGDEIWVKEARYVRKRGAPQVLLLKNGVAVYGGFAGGETALAQRDPALHETILDGEQAVANVVVTPGGGRLDGFTVTGGGVPPSYVDLGGGFAGNGATLARLVFRDNRAFSGGAVSGRNLVVEDSLLEDNHASTSAGAIRGEEGLTIRRSTFRANAATGPSGAANGGAVGFAGGALTIEDSSFESNLADELGGALVASGDPFSASLVVRRSSFSDNRARRGGALATTMTTTLLVEDSAFARNAAVPATTACGPVCSAASQLPRGGAVSASLSQVTLRDTLFSANSSSWSGGAVDVELGSLWIEHARFEDNTAVQGGGLLLDRTPHLVTYSLFQRNQAITGGGGGAALYPVAPSSAPTVGTFERCRFEANFGSVGGGALALSDGDVLVESSRFVGNEALLGGGIVASSTTPGIEARLEMRNAVVAFNQASGDGAGLWLARITAQLDNDTFYGNAAQGSGGGIGLDTRADVTVRNTILWNDTALSDPEIQLGSMVTLSIEYSDVEGGWPGTGNLNVDPGLRDPSLRDFHLTYPGSKPLVDAGTPGFAPVFDFDGELRPIDGNLDGVARVDIGADELADPCAGQLDRDLDGRCDVVDNCPFAPNPGQQDTGGIGPGSPPDGIGDACQCGDVNGDGRVTLTDSVLITRSLLVPPTATLARPDLCDVGGSDGCSLADAVVVRRALLLPPTATVQPACAPGQP